MLVHLLNSITQRYNNANFEPKKLGVQKGYIFLRRDTFISPLCDFQDLISIIKNGQCLSPLAILIKNALLITL